MVSSRRINVFYRVDGQTILDRNWDEDGVHPTETSDTPHIPSETLWPLIQVFIQFAREVQGGSVKRLVFRNPQEYAPTVKRFQPAPKQKKDNRPVVVYVAHDELFVVAVVEMLSEEHGKLGLENEKSEQSAPLTISEFCESVLEFLSKEQESFLGAQNRQDLGERLLQPSGRSRQATTEGQTLQSENVANFQGFAGIMSSTSSSASGSSGLQTGHSQSSEGGDASLSTAPRIVVKVNEAKLAEFVSRTQNLLRM